MFPTSSFVQQSMNVLQLLSLADWWDLILCHVWTCYLELAMCSWFISQVHQILVTEPAWMEQDSMFLAKFCDVTLFSTSEAPNFRFFMWQVRRLVWIQAVGGQVVLSPAAFAGDDAFLVVIWVLLRWQ